MNATSETKINRTKRHIRRSFLTLIQQKHVSQITVKELTEAAEINRSTFYAYYDSVEDLDRELEKEFSERFIETLKNAPVDTGIAREKLIRDFTLVMLGKQENVLWLYSENTLGICEKRIREFCRDWYVPLWLELSDRSEEEAYLYFDMLYGSSVIFARDIFEGNHRENDKQMADLFLEYLEAVFILMYNKNFMKEYRKDKRFKRF